MIFDSRMDFNLCAAAYHSVTTLELDGMFQNMKNGTYSLGAHDGFTQPICYKRFDCFSL